MTTHAISREDMMQSIEHRASQLLRGDSDFNDKISKFAVSLRRASEPQLRAAHGLVASGTFDEISSALVK